MSQYEFSVLLRGFIDRKDFCSANQVLQAMKASGAEAGMYVSSVLLNNESKMQDHEALIDRINASIAAGRTLNIVDYTILLKSFSKRRELGKVVEIANRMMTDANIQMDGLFGLIQLWPTILS